MGEFNMNYQQVWDSIVNQIKIINQNYVNSSNNPIPYPNGFVIQGMNLAARFVFARKCIDFNNPSERDLFDKVIKDMVNQGYITEFKSGGIKLTQNGVTSFLP